MTATAELNPTEARQSDRPLRVTLSAELAARVRSARNEARMTQAQLADLTASTLSGSPALLRKPTALQESRNERPH